jgi:hypothetical protein
MTDAAAQGWAENNISRQKAIIMVPTRPMADQWKGTEVFSSEAGHDRIRQSQHRRINTWFSWLDMTVSTCQTTIAA